MSDGRTTTNKSLTQALLGTFLLVQQRNVPYRACVRDLFVVVLPSDILLVQQEILWHSASPRALPFGTVIDDDGEISSAAI